MTATDPLEQLSLLEMSVIAARSSCRHCDVDNTVVHDNQLGWHVEHHHHRGCPEHEDFLPPAVAEGELTINE